ncbi:MAG TPA: flap endonuclease-1 [Nanoarchaeota archaeon]|nr:flap endonuclease-1 [Nanoarchaeota archaeon]
MGVQLREIIPRKEIELEELTGKRIAIDAFNALYQFLSIIRDRETGEPLKDSKGRITSHLSGLFYRTINLMEKGIKPVYVFDGTPPNFKEKTQEERKKLKEEMIERYEKAKEIGDIEEIRVTAQATAILTKEMVEQAKALLSAMGVAWVQAPSEGEAQCACLARAGKVFAAASQDYDALLFGAPILVRNLSITGKRKVPRKDIYIEIKPEIIELETVLKELKITREQLIMLAMLVGTDYNPGIKGYGPKKALELVRNCKTLDTLLKKIDWEKQFKEHGMEPIDAHAIFEFFLNPPCKKIEKIEFSAPDKEKIIKLLVDEFEFSYERVEKHVKILEQCKTTQSSLSRWF